MSGHEVAAKVAITAAFLLIVLGIALVPVALNQITNDRRRR